MPEVDTAEDGYIHLNKNLYSIDSKLLRYADGTPDASGFKFLNPRHMMINGKASDKGFSHAEMDQLRESIRTQGLQHPLMAFGTGNLGSQALILLNGERRKRCIDKLKADNAMCIDPGTGKEVPATELYQFIECRVFVNITLQEAYRHAFSGNDTAVGIGEGATICLVKQWVEDDWDEEQIAAATGKSPTWLRDTLSLVGLDKTTFDAFVADEINRTVALCLAKLPSPKERHVRLANLKQLALKRVEEAKRKAEMVLEQAEIEADIASAKVADAARMGDEKTLAQAQKQVAQSVTRIAHRQRSLEVAASRRARVNSKDLETSNREENSSASMKSFTAPKYTKLWKPVLDSVVEKSDDEKHPGIDPWDAKLVRYVIEHGWTKGEADIARLLREHALEKNK